MHTTDPAFTFSDDKSLLDTGYIHHYLSTQSYWAQNIPLDTVQRSIEGSLCFGIYHSSRQIGFARMVTDGATFAYLADVFVDEAYRGRGLSKQLIKEMLAHPLLQGLRRVMLATRDAHGLYAQFGFTPLPDPERIMQLHFPERYKTKSSEAPGMQEP